MDNPHNYYTNLNWDNSNNGYTAMLGILVSWSTRRWPPMPTQSTNKKGDTSQQSTMDGLSHVIGRVLSRCGGWWKRLEGKLGAPSRSRCSCWGELLWNLLWNCWSFCCAAVCCWGHPLNLNQIVSQIKLVAEYHHLVVFNYRLLQVVHLISRHGMPKS